MVAKPRRDEADAALGDELMVRWVNLKEMIESVRLDVRGEERSVGDGEVVQYPRQSDANIARVERLITRIKADAWRARRSISALRVLDDKAARHFYIARHFDSLKAEAKLPADQRSEWGASFLRSGERAYRSEGLLGCEGDYGSGPAVLAEEALAWGTNASPQMVRRSRMLGMTSADPGTMHADGADRPPWKQHPEGAGAKSSRRTPRRKGGR